MYTDMVPKISCQFLIGNVYHISNIVCESTYECQFLIGNVYLAKNQKK
jgi:hypothetical protein